MDVETEFPDECPYCGVDVSNEEGKYSIECPRCFETIHKEVVDDV